jgi:glycoside/pentoside/hexuronide:cation symporter, GPH family
MTFSLRQLFAYGLFGLPLSLLALPVYVQVPQLYAGTLGLSLTAVGSVLLAARLFDAFIDPVLGGWMDRTAQTRGHAGFVLMSLGPLAAGYLALFHPPAMSTDQLYGWFGLSLVVVYVGFSMATIAHNSWGASLTQQRGERGRLTATREACALAGVIIAAALPMLIGMAGLSVVFIVLLAVTAVVLLRYAPRAQIQTTEGTAHSVLLPLREPQFRWLLAVFAINGIAAAIPATLFMFFASDGLQLSAYAGLFLVLYFVAAALALPAWAKLAGRVGEANAWLAGMLLAVMAFVWTAQLESGALLPFAVICILSGMALGADLALPPALLAGVIGAAGHSGQREGAYFGLWSWMTKLNLALAAGIALPLLDWLGYTPGQASEEGLRALVIAYALLPCVLKVCAALLLWRSPLKQV